MNTMKRQKKERGAVALFVVVFATLLMTIITISFIQLMLKDQRQATASDLSQSAYDSANSGVEDAKRLLLLGQSCRNDAAPAAVNCDAVLTAIDSGECNTVASGLSNGGNASNTETIVQQEEGDGALQQAYTCVTIKSRTDDYKGVVGVNQSNIVPLKGVRDFDTVTISWFTRDDVSATTNSLAVGFPTTGPRVDLPRMGARWATNYPALLRTQLLQTGSSFRLSDADDTQAGKSNANTLFLYPSATGVSNMSFALDARRDPLNAPQQARCVNSFTLGEYACSVMIALPEPVNGSALNRTAFLRLSALYNGTHYKVQLYSSGSVVEFDQVQPEVDSTGRANDMFRRVKSRVELKSDFIYPEAAVDIEGDLCKSFVITDLNSDYDPSPTCIP